MIKTKYNLIYFLNITAIAFILLCVFFDNNFNEYL